MKRRDLLLAVGAALASPLVLSQQPGKIYRIGFLGAASPTPEILKTTLEPFRQAMRERGWIEGTNYAIVERWAEGRIERHAGHAEELVGLGVDLLLGTAVAQIRPAMKATQTIPIVMIAPADPERDGLIASYARPGGNVTGLTFDAGISLAVKQLDYLRQIVPGMSRLGVVFNEAMGTRTDGDVRAAGKNVKIEVRSYPVREAGDFEPTLAKLKQEGMQAVLVVADGLTAMHRSNIAQMALKHRLPLSSQWQGFPAAGGLLSYGPDLADSYRGAADYVDKILRGAKPADLPVQRPTRFRLVINLKTAKTLGLTVPQTVLLVAEDVIE